MLQEDELRKIFVDTSGLLTEEEFAGSVTDARNTNESLQLFILSRYFIDEERFISLLSEYYEVPGTQLPIIHIEPEALKTISREYAANNQVLPFKIERDTLHVAMTNPKDTEVVNRLGSVSQHKLKIYVSSEEAILRALSLYNGDVIDLLRNKIEKQNFDTSTDVLGDLIEAAVVASASDVHVEPGDTETLIRFRIDGALQTVSRIDKQHHEAFIARIKVVSKLKMDEHRTPQDGRFTEKVSGKSVDVRVSMVPSVWGEKAVLRVLIKGAMHFNLTSLGFADDDLEKITRHLRSSHGMILLCGPTGSGKTTTLYGCIKSIASDRIDVVNISTVEDPIEYTISRITQIQIQPDIDLTFANGLRSLLRQDPDVLMVGEIRDGDTAQMATRAALVGRLLLSSVHAHDAVSAIPRMLSMESDPYLLADTLRLIIAQRLVRRLCQHCRSSYILDGDTRALLEKHHRLFQSLEVLHAYGYIGDDVLHGEELRLYKAVGCEHCNHTGYLGRVALYEVLEVDDRLRTHIANRQDILTIRNELYSQGFKTMFVDGLQKARTGVTDIAEVIRAVS
jgi:type IV pilus assembly protein PilB